MKKWRPTINMDKTEYWEVRTNIKKNVDVDGKIVRNILNISI